MLDVFNFASPQSANYQAFYGGGTTQDWIKPRGASMVRMLLIGAGGGGSNSTFHTGGGSGAITTWIGPAIFIPDQLKVVIGAGGAGGVGGGGGSLGSAGTATSIYWQGPSASAGYLLLTANGGSGGANGAGGAAGIASSNNYFGASGIFNSIAGQAGATGAITAPTTIFLSGGAGGSTTTGGVGSNVAVNYGYPTVTGGATVLAGTSGNPGNNGYFIMQPLFLGIGGAGGGGSTTTGGIGGKGGIGCGGGGAGVGGTTTATGGQGGDGAVFIWSW